MENNENNLQNQNNVEQANNKDKKITVVLLIIVLILVLAIGIGVGFLFAGNRGEEKNETENSVNQTENTTNNNTSAISEQEMYASIIEEYKKLAKDFDINNYDYDTKSIANLEEIIMVYRYPESNSQLGYTYYDIDKNGTKEMIVGLCDKDGKNLIPSSVYGYNTTLKKAEKIYHLDTLERGSVSIYDNGIIHSAGSAGAAVHIAEFGKIGANGYSYEQIEWVEEEINEEGTSAKYTDLNTKKLLDYKSWDEMTAKYLNNSNEVRFENIEVIELEKKNNSNDKKDEQKTEAENTNSNTTNNTTAANNEYNTAITEIKKCLKDENWIRNNLYITKDEMIGDDANINDQKINFIICKSSTKPIIVVQTSSDNARFVKIDLVTYENNKVKVERINQGHIYHGGFEIDANKCVVRSTYMHMGTNATILHSVADGKVSFIGSYSYQEYFENNENSPSGEYKYKYYIEPETESGPDKEVSEEEYKKHKNSLNESQYKFVSIGTELNNQNVDTYVK